jgi:hypothetical protein
MVTNNLPSATSLSALADQINDQHDRAIQHVKSALEHARQAGELLLQAKQQIPHGGWLTWLSANCRVSPRQAQKYLKVAKNWQAIVKNDATSHLTIDEAITTPRDEPLSGRGAWNDKLASITPGKMLAGMFENGFVLVFDSSKHPGYFHCYEFYFSSISDAGQAQETRRPMLPRGIAHLLTDSGYSPDDFVEVDHQDHWEHEKPPKADYPFSPYFGAEIRGKGGAE